MAIEINGTSGISGVDGSATTPALQGTDTNTGLTFGTDTVNVVTGGSTRATVDSSGRLLVGTSSTSGNATVHVNKGSSDGTDPGGLVLTNLAAMSSTGAGDDIGYINFGASTTGAVASYDAARILCEADGTWGSGDYPTRLVFFTTADSASSPTARFRIGNQGQHAMLSADYVLNLRSESAASGSIEAFYVARSATTLDNGTGVFAVYTNGSYATLSDQTQKKNIETTRDGYLDDLNRLRVVKYHWNEQEDTESKELGLIAQEVEQVFPGLISNLKSEDEETGEETISKGVKYSVLPVMLLKALQEATAKIEALETRVAQLEGGAS